MQRNTLLFTIFLAIFAAIVVGVNLGHMIASNSPPTTNNSQLTTHNSQPILTPTPTPIPLLTFTIDVCGVSLSYPSSYTKLSLDNNTTTFLNPLAPVEATTIQCQSFLPKVTPKGATATNFSIGSVSGTLYIPPAATDSAQDKEKLYLRNTAKKKDILISGSGDTFENLLKTLTIQ